MNQRFLTLEHKLEELQFEVLFAKHKNDIQAIYDDLMKAGLDDYTLGFWIWDIEHAKEYYSPGFRATLGFSDEEDFPNVPDSWQKQIEEKDMKIAMDNFVKHVESGGKKQYTQVVTYRKKKRGKVHVLCLGKVVSWEKGQPKLMIGVHKDPDI